MPASIVVRAQRGERRGERADLAAEEVELLGHRRELRQAAAWN